MSLSLKLVIVDIVLVDSTEAESDFVVVLVVEGILDIK